MLFKYSISGVQFYISLLDTSVLQSLYIVKKICLNKKKKRKNKKKKKEKENKTEKTKTIIISLKKASTSIIFGVIKVLLG